MRLDNSFTDAATDRQSQLVGNGEVKGHVAHHGGLRDVPAGSEIGAIDPKATGVVVGMGGFQLDAKTVAPFIAGSATPKDVVVEADAPALAAGRNAWGTPFDTVGRTPAGLQAKIEAFSSGRWSDDRHKRCTCECNCS